MKLTIRPTGLAVVSITRDQPSTATKKEEEKEEDWLTLTHRLKGGEDNSLCEQ